jgi:hyperosmotically inducible periplasmic protein
MKYTLPAAVSLLALLLAGCGRPATDHDDVGSPGDTRTGTGREEAPPVREHLPEQTDTAPQGAIDTEATIEPAEPDDQTAAGNALVLAPGDKAETPADVEVTRQIREALAQHEQVSTTAQNVRILTSSGQTTLRGPVKSTAEQQQIIEIAENVPGVTSVDNQLEVVAFENN